MKCIYNYSNDLQSKVTCNIIFVTLNIYCLLYNCIRRVKLSIGVSHILNKNVTNNIFLLAVDK